MVTIISSQTQAVELDAIVSVTARAMEVLGSRENALRWLRTPMPALRGETPLSVLDSASGIHEVENILGRIEQGVW